MFVRYAPLLAHAGARVIVEVQGELKPLLGGLDGVDVIARGDALPAFDLHCPLGSLPLAFGTRLDTIPFPQGYLPAPPAARRGAAATWRAARRLHAGTGSRPARSPARS